MDASQRQPRSYPRRPILIGKIDQDLVIAQLGVHFSDGRLTLAEFEARAEAVMFAHTDARLAEIVDDLPALERPTTAPRAHHINVRAVDVLIDRLRRYLTGSHQRPITR